MTTLSLDKAEQHVDETQQQLISGKRRRQISEALTGYLFVLPAALATFAFGLWPVVAGFYESLKSGSPITNRYVGLANYVRQLGSLTYAIMFALSFAFVYLAYLSWRKAYSLGKEHRYSLWAFLLPGYCLSTALIALGFILVTGFAGLLWVPVGLAALALAGFYVADQVQKPREAWDWLAIGRVSALLALVVVVWIGGPALSHQIGLAAFGWIVLLVLMGGLLFALFRYLVRIKTWQVIGSITMMGLLMLFGILLSQYTVTQLAADVADARAIASMILNQQVLDGTVDVTDDDARLGNLNFERGQVIVQVKVDGQTIEAPLAPSVYDELDVDKIARLETSFVNNQKVQVVLPDGTITEGQLTGIEQGDALDVGFVADEPEVVREIDIYSALNVGEAVVQRGGHTEPLYNQIYAALGILTGIATIVTMSWVRGRLSSEAHFHVHRWLHYGRVLMGVVVFLLFVYQVGSIQLGQQAAAGFGALSQEQFERAYEYVTGAVPPATLRPEVLKAQLLYWPQVFSILLGAFLIGTAYLVWQSAQECESRLGFAGTIFLAVALMVGGWLLISELPRALELGGRETEEAFNALTRTAMYSVGTVPVQLTLGLALAYLLFSEIGWGKSLYRVIYFMPYIAPSVATSTVFLVIFRLESTSLANRALSFLGIDPLRWLKEPEGIVRIFYDQVLGGDPLNIPESLAGPSLALTAVILYNIWVFSGYNAVVFLAGLGAIPTELYEAAEVDGAGRWSRFRNITLPLLSPTTFFLSMLSIIGTFKAFSHIYVLRSQATGKEIDTLSVHIFNTLYSANDPGYAAALAFSLFGVILILTLVQNRVASSQVFYG